MNTDGIYRRDTNKGNIHCNLFLNPYKNEQEKHISGRIINNIIIPMPVSIIKNGSK